MKKIRLKIGAILLKTRLIMQFAAFLLLAGMKIEAIEIENGRSPFAIR